MDSAIFLLKLKGFENMQFECQHFDGQILICMTLFV